MRRAGRAAVGALVGALWGFLAWAVAAVALAGWVGAQTTIDRFDLSGYGSAHTVMTANHMMTARWDAYGNYNGHVLDDWFPSWCQVSEIIPGNAAGVTLKIRLIPPAGYGVGCRPGFDQSAYYGWSTGTGWYEGQHYTAGYVSRSVYYVPGRDPASPDAYGTTIEVY